MRQSVSLHINENILDKAALYATRKGISLSDLVEKLLSQAIRERPMKKMKPLRSLDPFVQSLVGVVSLDDEDLDGDRAKENYLRDE
ncbi:DUF6364 family protein [Parabacteroides sp.]|uniref:DUF6364 family protein n=1 Tax=Parabacteroides sp. TaxID=1869337 RepID=UPI00257AF98E|nr:DUF6364 family protein [Parabacteroides sp.]